MPDATLFKERRVSPRIQVDIPIQYHLLNDKKEIEAVREEQKKSPGAKAIDISLSGIQIHADQPLHNGDVLHMDINLPGLPIVLPAVAEVVWADHAQGGLHFLKMSEEDVNVLKSYLNKAMKSRDNG
jgi:hypothetical protein